jgi:hypothetical protein
VDDFEFLFAFGHGYRFSQEKNRPRGGPISAFCRKVSLAKPCGPCKARFCGLGTEMARKNRDLRHGTSPSDSQNGGPPVGQNSTWGGAQGSASQNRSRQCSRPWARHSPGKALSFGVPIRRSAGSGKSLPGDHSSSLERI